MNLSLQKLLIQDVPIFGPKVFYKIQFQVFLGEFFKTDQKNPRTNRKKKPIFDSVR